MPIVTNDCDVTELQGELKGVKELEEIEAITSLEDWPSNES